MSDDWERLENEEVDAIAFIHSDYVNLFIIIDGLKVRFLLDDLEHLDNILKDLNIENIELNEI